MGNHWTDDLQKYLPCGPEALEWGKQFDTLAAAWEALDRADWMFWLIANIQARKNEQETRRMVWTICACIRFLPEAELQEVRFLLMVLEAWGDDRATIENIQDVRLGAMSAAARNPGDMNATSTYIGQLSYAVMNGHPMMAIEAVASMVRTSSPELNAQFVRTVREQYPNAPEPK